MPIQAGDGVAASSLHAFIFFKGTFSLKALLLENCHTHSVQRHF